MEFHKTCVDLNKLFFTSHENIIYKVCDELGMSEKADELVNKLLNDTFAKTKAMKDPDRPKKPKSSYMFFAAAVRDKVQKEHPDEKMGGISKVIGGMWQKLSEKEKEKYVKLANEDKDRFAEEMSSYKGK